MPQFYYLNPLGKKEEIFPHYQSIVPNCYVCEDQKARQLHIHESCIIVENTEEEINKAREEFIKKNIGNLLHPTVRNSNHSTLSSSGEKAD